MATIRQSSAHLRKFSLLRNGAVKLCLLLAAIPLISAAAGGAFAQGQSALLRRPDPRESTTSDAARRDAIASIPLEQLDAEGRAKVTAVVQDAAAFRRLPTQVIDCDPHLFLFLVRHPDVAVTIWQVLELSEMELRQTGSNRFELVEPTGTRLQAEFLHQSPEVHVIYGEGLYVGPILGRPVHGRCILVLRSGYVQETNGRHYVTTRLDTFLQVQERAPDLLTKLLHPLAGKTADHNFTQIVAFAGSLSRTAEVNHRGVQRLASQLATVQPEVRTRLAELAAHIAKNAERQAATASEDTPVLASHETAQ